jgi:hypothetical protein
MIEPVLWGLAGGLLGQSLKVIRHADLPKDARPALLADPMFWSVWLLLGLLGGFFALAYVRSGIGLPPILAINVGASAPLLAEKLVSTLPADGKTG